MNVVTKREIRHFLTALLIFAVVFVCGCGPKELPPDADTPWPANHEGVFRSEYGTLEFAGDGKSIKINLSEELALAVSLPSGEHEGEYAFTYKHGLWRYDKAEAFEIIVDDSSYRFMNDFQKTDENTVAIISPIDAAVTIRFEKEE